MNGLRTRLFLDSRQQKVHNRLANTGDRLVGWFCCIGLAVFVLYEIARRFA